MAKKDKDEITLEEAKELLLIDKFSLDTVCEQHPELYNKVAEAHIMTLSIRDAKKDEMERIWAERAQHYRTHATEKVTEAKVQELVLIDPLYTKAQEEFGDAKLEADLWGVMRDSFSQRASMIKSLSDLYTSGYFNLVSVQSTKPKQAAYHQTRDKIAKSRAGG